MLSEKKQEYTPGDAACLCPFRTDKTRPQINAELAEIAAEAGAADAADVERLLSLQHIDGALNPGSHVIQVRAVCLIRGLTVLNV